MARKKTTDNEIIRIINNFIAEADSETLVRIFNENFDGNLTYNVDSDSYELDENAATDLEIN